MGNKVRIEIQIRKELQHESCYYLPLRNGVAFPFFLALVFRNPVLSCKIKIGLILVSRHGYNDIIDMTFLK